MSPLADFPAAGKSARTTRTPGVFRGTEGSNPSPSSRESVSLRISPTFLEKPGFSASLGTMPGGNVGRDAQSRATTSRGVVVSLSSDIPVPQCCWLRFAILAGLAANEIGYLGVSDVGGALSWDRLRQRRARSAARARPVADASAPAACPRSGRAARAVEDGLRDVRGEIAEADEPRE